jgi:hypothetical protein
MDRDQHVRGIDRSNRSRLDDDASADVHPCFLNCDLAFLSAGEGLFGWILTRRTRHERPQAERNEEAKAGDAPSWAVLSHLRPSAST